MSSVSKEDLVKIRGWLDDGDNMNQQLVNAGIMDADDNDGIMDNIRILMEEALEETPAERAKRLNLQMIG